MKVDRATGFGQLPNVMISAFSSKPTVDISSLFTHYVFGYERLQRSVNTRKAAKVAPEPE